MGPKELLCTVFRFGGPFMGLRTGVSVINPWLPWGFFIITFTHDLLNSCSCINVPSFQGEITKKMRMLAAVRLKCFFSLSSSWKREGENGKNYRGEGPNMDFHFSLTLLVEDYCIISKVILVNKMFLWL